MPLEKFGAAGCWFLQPCPATYLVLPAGLSHRNPTEPLPQLNAMSSHVLSPHPAWPRRGSRSHHRAPWPPGDGEREVRQHLQRGVRSPRPHAEPALMEPALPAAADKCAQRHLHSTQQAGTPGGWVVPERGGGCRQQAELAPRIPFLCKARTLGPTE